MRRPKGNAGDRLVRALQAALEAFDGEIEVAELASRSWASITFSGERHRIGLRLEGKEAGAAADGFIAALPDRELDLPGHLLADIGIVSDERDERGTLVRLALEAITLEAC